NGIEVTRTICALQPHVGVIGFSMDGSEPMVKALLAAGASDHIMKGENIKELLAAIRKSDGKGKGSTKVNSDHSEQPKYVGI
ncbi:MAG: response regulator, partial [Desulfatiglandaceae bacterium]